MLSFFPRGVLVEILNLIGSVSEGFPSYSSMILRITFLLTLKLISFHLASIVHMKIVMRET